MPGSLKKPKRRRFNLKKKLIEAKKNKISPLIQ